MESPVLVGQDPHLGEDPDSDQPETGDGDDFDYRRSTTITLCPGFVERPKLTKLLSEHFGQNAELNGAAACVRAILWGLAGGGYK